MFNDGVAGVVSLAVDGLVPEAGSAITFYNVPGKENEECLLKAAAVKKVLGG